MQTPTYSVLCTGLYAMWPTQASGKAGDASLGEYKAKASQAGGAAGAKAPPPSC
jgi:hypothetical protein